MHKAIIDRLLDHFVQLKFKMQTDAVIKIAHCWKGYKRRKMLRKAMKKKVKEVKGKKKGKKQAAAMG